MVEESWTAVGVGVVGSTVDCTQLEICWKSRRCVGRFWVSLMISAID